MIAFEKHILENGLTLLIHEDHSTPFSIVNTLYKVGAKDEDENRTGFAHLFEHLMFGGSKNAPNFDTPLQLAGGQNNAFTNNDFTNYYDVVPSNNLDIALWLEADRMNQLDINSNSLEVQRKVVIEEFKENYLNKPYGDVWHILRTLVYEKHSYRWPTIGKNVEHIEKATLQDVQEFYTNHYQPQNAIMCVAGSITTKDVIAQVKKYFNDIESPYHSKGKITDEPAQSEAKLLTVKRDVPQSSIYVVYKMPERNSKDYYISDLISDYLANGSASVLVKSLVKEKRYFTEIDAYISASLDTGMFVIEGKINDDISPELAHQSILDEMHKLQTELLEEREMEKLRNKVLTFMNFSENSLMSRAIGLCFHEMIGDAEDINGEMARYEEIQPQDFQKFATSFLNVHQHSCLKYLKQND